MNLSRLERRAARLEEGDLLEAEITAEGILLRPQTLIDSTQAWFCTPEWQESEREADVDLAAGKTESFGSGEEFIGALRSRAKAKSTIVIVLVADIRMVGQVRERFRLVIT